MATCIVCGEAIEPGPRGVRYEGTTEQAPPHRCVYGPYPVHEDCRLYLISPQDDEIMEIMAGGTGRYAASWEYRRD